MTYAPTASRPGFLFSLASVYSYFESLGNNCEFGIVQERAEIDPPGLFRNVGFIDTEQMIRVIRSDFSGMFEADSFAFDLPEGWRSWRLHCRVYGFGFHTTIPSSLSPTSPRWASETDRALKVFRFLREKMKQDLRDGDKIFVYRTIQDVTAQTALQLLEAIRAWGKGPLLFVRQDPSVAAGTVRFHGNGLILGYVDRLSNSDPPRVNFAAWEKMAREVLSGRERGLLSISAIPSPQDG